MLCSDLHSQPRVTIDHPGDGPEQKNQRDECEKVVPTMMPPQDVTVQWMCGHVSRLNVSDVANPLLVTVLMLYSYPVSDFSNHDAVLISGLRRRHD